MIQRTFLFNDETQTNLFIENLDLVNLLPRLDIRMNIDNSIVVSGRLFDMSATEQIYRMEHA